MKTQSLRTFLILASTASFTETAKAQKVTQSAVSQSLKALEKDFNNTLVLRSQGRNQKVTLTKAGKELRDRAKLIVSHLDKAIEKIASMPKETVEKAEKAAPAPKAAKKEKAVLAAA